VDPARVARVDLQGVSNAQARRALANMAGAVEKELKKVAWVRLRGIDLDDLRAIAQLAVLESVVTYNESRGRKWSSWAYQLIRWRLQEAVRLELEREAQEVPMSSSPGFALDAASPSPEATYLAREERAQVEKHLAQLPPRAGMALACKLQGESLAEIGASVGVHYSLVCREIQDAVRTVSEAVAREEVEP
jgi:RNA polymerase sigma factor (sigma-70 family)